LQTNQSKFDIKEEKKQQVSKSTPTPTPAPVPASVVPKIPKKPKKIDSNYIYFT